MRILTGKDRIQYEELLKECGELAAAHKFCQEILEITRTKFDRTVAQCDHERQRADNAVDALLAVRGVPPISPPPPPPEGRMDSPYDEDPDEAARMEKELAARTREMNAGMDVTTTCSVDELETT